MKFFSVILSALLIYTTSCFYEAANANPPLNLKNLQLPPNTKLDLGPICTLGCNPISCNVKEIKLFCHYNCQKYQAASNSCAKAPLHISASELAVAGAKDVAPGVVGGLTGIAAGLATSELGGIGGPIVGLVAGTATKIGIDNSINAFCLLVCSKDNCGKAPVLRDGICAEVCPKSLIVNCMSTKK